METDEEVISGYLLFPPGGIVFNKINKKKNWQQKFCQLFNVSKQGIERLEIYDSKEDARNGGLPKLITLKNCIKITQSSPNTITIFTKSFTQHLSTTTDLECSQWLTALQSVAFKDADSNLKSCNEDNDLYCSSIEGVFSVKLVPSDASIRCGLEPDRYLLLLTINALELRDVNDNNLHATWPYRYIRRYGHRKGKFTFEAGRKCETGEGIFHLEHPSPHEIMRCLSLKMKAMKQLIGNDNLNSPEHNDLQIQPSPVNMFPGSRSPFIASRPDDLNLSSISLKINSVSSITNSDTAPLLNPKRKPLLKPKPQKPPRKSLPKLPNEIETPKNGDNSESSTLGKLEHYEHIADEKSDQWPPLAPYDKVEVRNEAWKTLGINEIDHNEFTPNLSEKSNSIKFISRSQDNLNSDVSRIILLPSPVISPDEENYDRLGYFGSSSKLDHPDYKKVEPRPSTLSFESLKSKDTWNDYDEVENVMQAMRSADDSHLGYGVIRKGSASGAMPGPQVPTAAQAAALTSPTQHPFSHYAIVSRPKRV